MVTIRERRRFWGAAGPVPGGGAGTGAVAAGASAFPQLAQNFTPWRLGLPQWGQGLSAARCSRGAAAEGGGAKPGSPRT